MKKETLLELISALEEIAGKIKLVFPLHPRTRKNLENFGIKLNNIIAIDPVGYIDFLKLEKNAKLVFTDSGGVQTETTIFNVPCLTLRNNTERPATLKFTNQLVGTKKGKIISSAFTIIDNKQTQQGQQEKCKQFPEYWDGKAAKRIVEILRK